jgi:hypothetical protein
MQDPETQEEEAQWERERRGDYSEPSTSSYEDLSEGRGRSSFSEPDTSTTSEEEDDSLNYFAKLVNS